MSAVSTVEELRKDVQMILDSNRAFIEKTSELPWQPTDGNLSLILRTILRRQFDSLESISHLVEHSMGFAAGPILRPSCEELIWTKYLLSIARGTAEDLIRCIAAGHVYERLNAQCKAVRRDGMENLGLASHLDRRKLERKTRNKSLRKIGTLLNWPGNTIRDAALPSVAWIAKKTGEQLTYDLIYSATSRFVHFSPSVTLKSAWYQGQHVTISSKIFEPYWSHF